ncbi:aryl hydrocarbon receptor-like isoform X2 [Acanthaster planci]|uniref:Aryl hydrocarbon receptor-like isoform X2 n=1 Tax=Acanthaster planci TaxID=133434 RepID=A0A8B7Y0F6_ACAPL|nr:aryl hydrocarbon receptor-like isoform X2 [Acanthaster planci]
MLSQQCGGDDYGIHSQPPRGTLPGPTAGMSPYARPTRQHPPQQHAGLRSTGSSKIDPSSFKSKRYRDKLREQIKALENLLPIDKATLHRKLDSQTVFRLVISYFRTKVFFQVAGFSSATQDEAELSGSQTPAGRDPLKPIPAKRETLTEAVCKDFCDRSEVQLALEALDGFLLVVTSDGTILYSTENISSHLGFHQVDLVHRCLYGIVHPDDHLELKGVLEQTLSSTGCQSRVQMEAAYSVGCGMEERGTGDACKVSFLCRMKCFNGTSTGFVKMHCCGGMRSFPGAVKSSRTSCQVLFLAFRPITSLAQDTDIEFKQNVFWSKHEMDLSVKLLDTRAYDILGFEPSELEGKSLYDMIHPQDLAAMFACHKTLVDTDEIHTLYFRLMTKNSSWVWLHTRAKVITKNSRKHSIVLTHCPVREMDNSYLHQEARARTRYGLDEYLKLKHMNHSGTDGETSSTPPQSDASQNKRRWTSNDTYVVASQSPYKLKDDYSASLHSPHGACPSSYHQSSERHSPVYPSTYAPHRYQKAAQGLQSSPEKAPLEREPPPMNVNFYDYAHSSDDFIPGGPLHPNHPQPHPALSMYQMVAHLPPEMYDAESYRKHALMFMESHTQLAGPGMVPNYHHHHMGQYQLPLTPQTSPQSFYPQGHFPVHYPEHIPTGHPAGRPVGPETLSPPPSPDRNFKPACMYSSVGPGEGLNKGPEPVFPADCCKAEHYASLVVNGAVQVRLLDGATYPRTQYTNGYSHEYPHGDQYSSETSCLYGNHYESDIELKPFQRVNAPPLHKMDSSHRSLVSYAESPTGSNLPNHGYHSDRVAHDRERCLPCPMANTKNGCLAPKLPPVNEVRIVSPASSLPPIGSFLDFLNEDADIPAAEEAC